VPRRKGAKTQIKTSPGNVECLRLGVLALTCPLLPFLASVQFPLTLMWKISPIAYDPKDESDQKAATGVGEEF